MTTFFDYSGQPLEIIGEDFLCFRLDNQTYALHYALVEEIRPFDPDAILGVTNAPAAVLGAAYVSGRYVPLIDLRRHLGLAPARPGAPGQPQGHLIFLALQEAMVALRVDATEGVTIIEPDHVLPISADRAQNPIPVEARLGEHHAGSRHIVLVDAGKLLPAAVLARARTLLNPQP